MKCLSHSPQTLRSFFKFLEPELPWFPSLDYHGAEGAEKQVLANEPLGPAVSGRLWTESQGQEQGRTFHS